MRMSSELLCLIPNIGNWGWSREKLCLRGCVHAVEIPRWDREPPPLERRRCGGLGLEGARLLLDVVGSGFLHRGWREGRTVGTEESMCYRSELFTREKPRCEWTKGPIVGQGGCYGERQPAVAKAVVKTKSFWASPAEGVR